MKNYVWALILGIGVALSGYFIYCGIEKIANKDRHVTVKGLSEREVMADKVTWSLSYNVAGNALEFLYESLEPKQDKLIKFLKSNGVKEDEIFLDVPSAEDRSSWYNWNEKKDVMARFVVTGRLTIVSSDVEKIMTLRMKQLDLLKQGVLLDNSYCSYEYTGLNDLKPEMVEEATKNARIVAQKFAEDAGAKLGSICTAVTNFLITFADEAGIANLHSWSMGSFSAVSWRDLGYSAAVILRFVMSAMNCIRLFRWQ